MAFVIDRQELSTFLKEDMNYNLKELMSPSLEQILEEIQFIWRLILEVLVLLLL